MIFVFAVLMICYAVAQTTLPYPPTKASTTARPSTTFNTVTFSSGSGDLACPGPSVYPPIGYGSLCVSDGAQGSCQLSTQVYNSNCTGMQSQASCWLWSLYCQVPDEPCYQRLGGSCRENGLSGTCKERQYDYSPGMSYVACVLNDKSCSQYGQSCAANGVQGYCSTNSDVTQLLCNDGKFGAQCQSVDVQYCTASEQSCYNLYDGQALPEGTACNHYGVGGTCKSKKPQCYSASLGNEMPCPTLSPNATYLTPSELEAYCSPLKGAGCASYASYCVLPNQFIKSILSCQLGAIGVSISQMVDCVMTTTTCKKVDEICVENNAFGICRQATNKPAGTLECYDRSDNCPLGTPCILFNSTPDPNALLKSPVGQCTDDYFCTPLERSCKSPTDTCYRHGYEGTCGNKPTTSLYGYDQSVTPDGCKMKDSAVCGVSNRGRECIVDGHLSNCGFSDTVMRLKCPEIYQTTYYYPTKFYPTKFYPDYTYTVDTKGLPPSTCFPGPNGIICPGQNGDPGYTFGTLPYTMGPLPPQPPGTGIKRNVNAQQQQQQQHIDNNNNRNNRPNDKRQFYTTTGYPYYTTAPDWTDYWSLCYAKLEQAGIIPVCQIDKQCEYDYSNPFQSMTTSATCYTGGYAGTCKSRCYAKDVSGPVYVACKPSDTSSTTVLAWVKTICDVVKSSGYLPSLCQTPQVYLAICVVAGGTYDTQCVAQTVSSNVGFGSETSCELNNTKCNKLGDICVENGEIGECIRTAPGQSLTCYEKTDRCPRGTECKVERPIGSSYLCITSPPQYLDRCGVCGGQGDCGDGIKDRNVTLSGLCSSQYDCLVREQQCGTAMNVDQLAICYSNGRQGSCESKNKAQLNEITNCLMTAGDDLSAKKVCYSKYSVCFTGCRYPTQTCGANKACSWPQDSQATQNQWQTELVCRDSSMKAPVMVNDDQVLLIDCVLDSSNYGTNDVDSILRTLKIDEWASTQLDYQTRDVHVYVMLRRDYSIDRIRRASLDALLSKLQATNGIKEANLMIDDGQSTAATCMPACSSELVCIQGLCLPKGSTPGNVTLLSQWLFSRESAQDDIKLFVNHVIDETADASLYALIRVQFVSSDDLNLYIVKLYYSTVLGSAQDLSFNHDMQLLRCYEKLSQHPRLVGFTALIPQFKTNAPAPVAKSSFAPAFASLSVVALLISFIINAL